MSSAYITEQQQIEQLKQWWKKNGASTVLIFLGVIIISLGWHYWLKHREDKLERGSSHYESMLNAVVNDDEATALRQANLLKENYAHTPYAALATLVLARSDVYQNNYRDAQAQLNWVVKHASTHSLKQVARLRLARIHLQEGQPKESLRLLEKVNDDSYLPLINEVRGDSYLAMKQISKARTAYQQAISALPDFAALRPLLRMKLDNLAEADTDNTPDTENDAADIVAANTQTTSLLATSKLNAGAQTHAK